MLNFVVSIDPLLFMLVPNSKHKQSKIFVSFSGLSISSRINLIKQAQIVPLMFINNPPPFIIYVSHVFFPPQSNFQHVFLKFHILRFNRIFSVTSIKARFGNIIKGPEFDIDVWVISKDVTHVVLRNLLPTFHM